MASFLWPYRFIANTMRTPLSVSARVTCSIFSKLSAAPGPFQKQSKLVKTHTRYKIRYMPEKPLLISSAEKNANQGRVQEGMVGSWGLEPQTSTVSKRRDQVLPTTWEALGTA
jgi:hypothetical protein